MAKGNRGGRRASEGITLTASQNKRLENARGQIRDQKDYIARQTEIYRSQGRPQAEIDQLIGNLEKYNASTRTDLVNHVGVTEQQFNQLIDNKTKVRIIADEPPKPPSTKREPAEPRTFVNSFGEATTREITTLSYRRAQRRIDKQIELRFRNR